MSNNPKLKKFVCSYAHDIPAYLDFTVMATNKKDAEEKIEKALKDGVFENCDPEPCFENTPENKRVFVSSLASEWATATTLEDIIEENRQKNSI